MNLLKGEIITKHLPGVGTTVRVFETPNHYDIFIKEVADEVISFHLVNDSSFVVNLTHRDFFDKMDWCYITIIIKECQHEYKLYQGFTQSYNYCIKCDHKQ